MLFHNIHSYRIIGNTDRFKLQNTDLVVEIFHDLVSNHNSNFVLRPLLSSYH